eukprot:Blabericola_migrator_1__605@NODE_1148_length_5275_cov_33_353303_g782_i0_p1_GENE_NODE_1148_length_5275_cov_33_353303_g782_i0NODE_1148_length_5275_cov_33_353303_g782_i0_p1_ORF_typecomplete_len577_score65_26LANC_like/PF05147_13/0_073_NODE_1148_length_5275_cov_33_353303_g782_i01861916
MAHRSCLIDVCASRKKWPGVYTVTLAIGSSVFTGHGSQGAGSTSYLEAEPPCKKARAQKETSVRPQDGSCTEIIEINGLKYAVLKTMAPHLDYFRAPVPVELPVPVEPTEAPQEIHSDDSTLMDLHVATSECSTSESYVGEVVQPKNSHDETANKTMSNQFVSHGTLELPNATLPEACIAYSTYLRGQTADKQKAIRIETIRATLQYIARCFDAGLTAAPQSCYELENSDFTINSWTPFPDLESCLFFIPKQSFRLLHILLTVWEGALPPIQYHELACEFSSIRSFDETSSFKVEAWLKRLLDWKSRDLLLIARKRPKHVYNEWMLSVMERIADMQLSGDTAEAAYSVLKTFAREICKRHAYLTFSVRKPGDCVDWISLEENPSQKKFSKAGKGAAKILHLLARCPLEVLDDAQVSACLKALEEVDTDPVHVCEHVWHATVLRTQEILDDLESCVSPYWNDTPTDPIEATGTAKLYVNLGPQKEGFWARVSWLFLNKFVSLSQRVRILCALPHEGREAKHVTAIADALNACVGQAFEELSCQSRLSDAIQLGNVYDILPAITLLRTHMATLTLPNQ